MKTTQGLLHTILWFLNTSQRLTLDVLEVKHPSYTYRPGSQEVDEEVAAETC